MSSEGEEAKRLRARVSEMEDASKEKTSITFAIRKPVDMEVFIEHACK